MNINLIQVLNKIPNYLRHPFFILLVGSIISSYLIPSILSKAARNESNRKEKINLAFEFLNRNTEVNNNFNSLLVSLELFHKYSSTEYLNVEQRELRKNSKELYKKFNTNVWYWHWILYEKIKMWKLVPKSDGPYIKKALERYNNSWTKVLEKFQEFCEACVDENYRVRDPNITKLMYETRQEFNNSSAVRDSVIRFVISKFDLEQIN